MFGMFTLLIYVWKIPAARMYPVVEGFIENMEAIEHFEEVFDSAAVIAGAKVEETSESERRWDNGDEYERGTRQADFIRAPLQSRTIFRDDNEDLRINIRGNTQDRTRNQKRYQGSQSSEYYQRDSEGRQRDFGPARGRFDELPERSYNNPGNFFAFYIHYYLVNFRPICFNIQSNPSLLYFTTSGFLIKVEVWILRD